jgi:hypothetical protein
MLTSTIRSLNHSNEELVPSNHATSHDLGFDQPNGLFGSSNNHALFFSKKPDPLGSSCHNKGKISPDDSTLSTVMLSDHTSRSALKMNDVTPTFDNSKSRKGKRIPDSQPKADGLRIREGISTERQPDVQVRKLGITRKTTIRVHAGTVIREKSSDSILLPPETPSPSLYKIHARSNQEKSLKMSNSAIEEQLLSANVLDVTTVVEGQSDVGATAPVITLKKCICNWKNCRAYQKAFRDAKHPVLDGVITMKIFKDHVIGMHYKRCLDRALGVTKEPDWKEQSHSGSVKIFCKYVIAKHHFTQSHMEKYNSIASNNSRDHHTKSSKLHNQNYSFLKPFSVAGAKKYLYAMDDKDIFEQPNQVTKSSPYERFYMQTPNVPNEVVRVEFLKALEVINHLKKQKTSHGHREEETADEVQSNEDAENLSKSRQRQTMKSPRKSNNLTNTRINQINVGTRRGSLVSSLESNSDYDDDPISGGDNNELFFNNEYNLKSGRYSKSGRDEIEDDETVSLIKVKDAENRELQDQLEFMQTQLSVLHDMVSTLQMQQIALSYSNALGSGGFSTNFNHSNRSRLSTLNQKHQQSRRRNVGGSITRSTSLDDVPNEIDVDSDEDGSKNDDNKTMSTTDVYSRPGSIDGVALHQNTDLLEADKESDDDDDDSTTGADVKTVATTGTFVSKYKQIISSRNQEVVEDDASAS